MSIKIYLKKLQNLPLRQRKTILWIIVSIFAIIFLFLLSQNTKKRWEEVEPLSIPIFEELRLPETPGPSIEGFEGLKEEETFPFEMTPEMKESLERFLEESLKALRESDKNQQTE